MTTVINIPEKLPGLNEYISACRTHWSVGARMKSETQQLIAIYLASEKRKGAVCHTGKVTIDILYTEANRKRDLDNIESAAKFILDALQDSGFIVNDSPKYVVGLTQTVTYGEKYNIRVTIREA